MSTRGKPSRLSGGAASMGFYMGDIYRSDLESLDYGIAKRFEELERSQKEATSRIRQDLSALYALVLILALAAAIFLFRYPHWLILPILLIGQPALHAYLIHQVQMKEEPWLRPAETEKQKLKREKLAAKWAAERERARLKGERVALKKDAEIEKTRARLMARDNPDI